jgi:alpha-D-ribose 1-methylphosphonate 5-triphosphate diphosphatase
MLRPPLAERRPSWRIEAGRRLADGRFEDAPLVLADGRIAADDGPADRRFDATGLLVLPGIVDVHGDAFERQLMPRPGVGFDLATALFDTDRQLLANGITTAFHGVTRSWEPGLRGADNARALLDALESLADTLVVDTRFHLRHETFNLDGEAELIDWISRRRVGCLAFNDHMSAVVKSRSKPQKLATMVERSGLDHDDFVALIDAVHARADEVRPSIERLAAAARAAGVPMLSHDDVDPAMRHWYRDLGVAVSEFPTNEATARAAVAEGEATVFGAPNVLRGGSHTGCPGAAEMVAKGLCSILASDYYYPALTAAPFRLAADGVGDLAATWDLVSANPAAALGLADRGRLAAGLRADVILVEAVPARPPRVVATFVDGRLAHCADGARIA